MQIHKKKVEQLELELFDIEIYELERMKEEVLKRIIYEVEWFYEVTGECVEFSDVCFRVDEQMEQDWLIYNVTDVFYELCEKAYFEIVDELFFN